MISKTYILSAGLLGLMAAGNSYAGCKMEDVRYFLSEGFSHDEVVSMCASSSPAPATATGASVAAPVAATENSRRYGDEASQNGAQGRYFNRDEETLKTSLVGHDLQLDATTLTFTQKKCIKYGSADAVADFKDQACPFVIFDIKRQGLQINEVNEGLWGLTEASIIISGDITRTIKNLEKYKPKAQVLMKESLGSGPELKLILRKGVPPYTVSEALKNISNP